MLEQFRKFLEEEERLAEKNVPYYLKRVADCYRYFDLSDTVALTNEQSAKFLKHMSMHHEDWQVQQADRAIRLYTYFLSRLTDDTSSWQLSRDWQTLEQKLIEALRLRHRSLSTEKTYVSWTRHFGKFLNWRGLPG